MWDWRWHVSFFLCFFKLPSFGHGFTSFGDDFCLWASYSFLFLFVCGMENEFILGGWDFFFHGSKTFGACVFVCDITLRKGPLGLEGGEGKKRGAFACAFLFFFGCLVDGQSFSSFFIAWNHIEINKHVFFSSIWFVHKLWCVQIQAFIYF